ncbi:MAG: hypothetical protein R3C97_13445 [Geminicoccaceae bacterium]
MSNILFRPLSACTCRHSRQRLFGLLLLLVALAPDATLQERLAGLFLVIG